MRKEGLKRILVQNNDYYTITNDYKAYLAHITVGRNKDKNTSRSSHVVIVSMGRVIRGSVSDKTP